MLNRYLRTLTGPGGAGVAAATVAIGALSVPASTATAQGGRIIIVQCAQSNSDGDDPGRPIYYPHTASASTIDEQQTEPTAESILNRFMQLHTAARYEEALIAADALVEMLPNHPLPHYNRACSLARLHRTHQALDALEAAIERGWRDLTHLNLDPDLQSVRWHDRYESLVASLAKSLDEPFDPMTAWQGGTSTGRNESLETLIPQWLDELHVPGVSVAIVQDGSSTWSRSFGVRDRSTGQPLAPRDLFAVAMPEMVHRLVRDGDVEVPEIARARPASFGTEPKRNAVVGHTWLGTPLCDQSSRTSCSQTKRAVGWTTAEQLGLDLATAFADRRHERAHINPRETPEDVRDTDDTEVMVRPASLEPSRGVDGSHNENVARRAGCWHFTSTVNGIGCHLKWNSATDTAIVVLYNGERGDELARRIARLVLAEHPE